MTWPVDADVVAIPVDWPPDAPVVGVCLPAVRAYAAWRGEQEGRRLRLPTEEEWEKLARGVDGRFWPWGDHFDPAFAHLRASRPGHPAPGPVGRFARDRSVYGATDLVGCVREWTASTWGDGRAVVRGGGWRGGRNDSRAASRHAAPPDRGDAEIGFRLVADEPPERSS